jgi:hypothetical protein
MSYSYIKTVFPDFNKTSNKIYDDSLYDINTIEKPTNLKQDIKESDSKSINSNISIDISKNKQIELPINNLLESYENTNTPSPYILNSSENQNKNNLQFYNHPINKEYLKYNFNSQLLNPNPIQTNPVQNSIKYKEESTCNFDCDIYIKHILECSKCKNIVSKQFGIENEKIRNEEILEMISYFIFALFILLLVDSLKK